MTGNEMAPSTGVAPTWRGTLRGALVCAPAVFAIWWGIRLGMAAWIVGGFGPGGGQDFDPFVAILRGGSAQTGVSVSEGQLEQADRLAIVDPRYAFRLALRYWQVAGGGTAGAQAAPVRESFAEAARRAPTDAVIRCYLALASRELGLLEDADREARAALVLAPLNGRVKERVSRYFEERYSGDGGRDLLSAALRGMEGDATRAAEFLRARSELPDEALADVVERAEVVPAFALEVLGRAGRWDLALVLARRWQASGRAPAGAEARTMLARGESRLAVGDFAGAREDAEAARAMLGPAFDGHLLLGEARLRTGDAPGGLAALGEALASGVSPQEVARRTAIGAAPAEDVVEFWRRAALSGAPGVRLEHARALVRVGHGLDAQDILRILVEVPETAGEANYLLAHCLATAGSRIMARRYAEEAVALDPRNEEYRRLLEEVSD